MSQAINPFTDEPIDNQSIVSHIKPREDLTDTTVAVRISQHNNPDDGSGVKFIEWDFLHNNAQDSEYQAIKPLIQGLWQNGYPLVDRREVISLQLLQAKLASASFPRTPKEKLDNLLLFIVSQQSEDGSSVSFSPTSLYKRLYFKSVAELAFYATALRDDGLVNFNPNNYDYYYLSLTHKGLLYAASLEQATAKSVLCFVAMSFDKAVNYLYTDAIKPALEATGFNAFRVDEHHPDAEQTINDAIIAGIKRSRFCIADFTQHKKGVYFEAGYALGRGMKVIYTCHSDEFKDSHFDTNHYPHIIYDTSEELRTRLIAKIEAWIKK
ncbi:hypothetical protein [Hymenobacter jejuensis]|uniref:CD-NTase-associated protein 12/Pycsar effector protein TIR domain-containing protein n=1 Tax=Hymenobacter jejuensis TaxID=2502781 RepID=A0A5B7ZZG6_9BACT|nr:hypothetical protein [Hymenobacter jejuensis]QDA60259.1 hypothetical protein FHG12_09100 [Hymenobacter jejuensis]